MCIYQCVTEVGVVEVQVFIYLHIICNHVTGRRIIWLVRLELKVVMQKDVDFVHVSQLYLLSHTYSHISVSLTVL